LKALFVEQPVLAAGLIFAAIMCGIFMERWRANMARKEWRARNGKWNNWRKPRRSNVADILPKHDQTPAFDAAQQLRCVMAASFNARSLLNKSEQRLFASVEDVLSEHDVSWRLMAQVSLGEILASPDKDAYFAINSKRVDLLLIDANSLPVHVIEYQGKGHHQGTAAARDAVKKEALRRAGIGYYEITAGDRPSDLRALIAKLVREHRERT
jgi:Protein of unknown function (DUF2726)